MKINLYLCLLVIIGMCFSGCGEGKSAPSIPKDAYPEQIGKWKGKYNSSGASSMTYQTAETDNNKKIEVSLRMRTNAEETKKTLEESDVCSKKVIEKGLGKEILKEQSVKDKSGNIIGEIKVCQQKWSDSMNVTFGKYSYSIALSNNNVIEIFDTYYQDIKYNDGKKAVSFNELIEFVKGVPYNAQIDFSDLNLEALDPSKLGNSVSGEELSTLTAPLKIAQKPYLKGKVVVFDGSYMRNSKFGIAENIQAKSADEVQTVVQIKCEIGKKIGEFTTFSDESIRIPAYGKTCKVTVIDKTIPATIAQKNFVNNKMPEMETFTKFGDGSYTDYVAPDPEDKIKSYLSGFAQQ